MPTMTDEKRIRLTFDVPDRVRRALAISAARRGLTVGEVITELAEDGLTEDLAIADRTIAQGGEGGKPKRGRKPKQE